MSEIKISIEDRNNLKKSVENLENKYKQEKKCLFCAGTILFKPDIKSRILPHDLDGTPHWKTCPYGSLAQKRTSFSILKKMALYFCRKDSSIDFELELGLSEKEGRIMHAIVEKLSKVEKITPSTPSKVDSDIPFIPEPNDPVGDPDEERAPSEELINHTSPSDMIKKE